ncbi:MAG: hypothetical protein ABEJ28_02325 [Salinigranum sp.]
MPLYALEDLDDALAATRAFLTPVDRTAWLKLAVVAFFISGPGANFSGFQYTFGGEGGGPPPGPVGPTVGPNVWLLIAGVVVALLVVALAFALVGSVMEFVFVESLRTEEVSVRRYWGRRWPQGLRLFGFRLVVGVFAFAAALLLAVPFLLPRFGAGGAGGEPSLAAFVVLLPLVLVLVLIAGLVDGFTTVFVVPVMVLEDCGVLGGWRRLWPTVTDEWEQYLAYAVAGFFLSIVGGVVVGIAVAVLALALLVPFGILFALGVGALVLAEPVGIAVLAVVGVLYALAILAVVALVKVPVETYLRYYALFVLGDVEPAFDLVADRRAAVRR